MTDTEGFEDGRYTAVVDSIEDGLATVFFERDGEEVGDAVLDSTVLPEDGRHADAILSVTVEDEAFVDWTYEPDRTETRKEAAQDRFDRLSSRPPSDEES
ncbi:DUF3006 domain-containing protein [Halomicroarcula sp. F13]|uniref:DUF3006 domain-containing protein n=1 Tax=Haloarcula rubra TaxID=2487747 RepID=A0AAW4Q109_9EURY|nr:DUF3006 family protein [Halomicroarcula rubra]MBX0326032.1 DUF3006 domain-containing protein [Halomicroarcula rubra]